MSGWLTVLQDMLALAEVELLFVKAPIRSVLVEGQSERERNTQVCISFSTLPERGIERGVD